MANTGDVGWAALPPIITTRAFRDHVWNRQNGEFGATLSLTLGNTSANCLTCSADVGIFQSTGSIQNFEINITYINLRTRSKRLVRCTICFFKMEWMPDLVIGLFINHYEVGRSI